MRLPGNPLHFTGSVTAGYFGTEEFFGWQFRQADIEFVARRIGINPAEVSIEAFNKTTYIRHLRIIIQHFGCGAFDEAAKTFLAREIAVLVRVQFRP